MEFSLPVGQVGQASQALKVAFENVFVGKAMRLKTDFTCKGLSNAGPDDNANTFFDSVTRQLQLEKLYRRATWLYHTVGIVPIIYPEPGKSLSYVQILDPRMVRFQEWYGKTYMYLVPDKRMLSAISDPKGTTNPFNKDYYEAMPKDWRDQLIVAQRAGVMGAIANGTLIKLKEGTYSLITNRYTPIDRTEEAYDGLPLQPYFAHAEQYRMLMAGDFAAAFLAKNLIALVSVGDPKAEGENYIRPGGDVLAANLASVQNANQAQWISAESTFDVRYITPDPEVFGNAKYAEAKEGLKNLLPDCFWSGDGGSFADSSVAVKALQEEVDQAHSAFDAQFWQPIFERAAEGRVRIGKKSIRAPKHDKNSLRDDSTWYAANSALYANGGLDIRSLLEAHGYDADTIAARMKEQQSDVKAGLWTPAFEGKQGIVEGMYQKAGTIPKDPKPAGPAKAAGSGKAGPKKKPGSRPQPTGSRAPRPSEKK